MESTDTQYRKILSIVDTSQPPTDGTIRSMFNAVLRGSGYFTAAESGARMPEMLAHHDCASAETVDDGFDVKGLDEMGHMIWGFFQYLQNRLRQPGYDGTLEGDVILPFGHD